MTTLKSCQQLRELDIQFTAEVTAVADELTDRAWQRVTDANRAISFPEHVYASLTGRGRAAEVERMLVQPANITVGRLAEIESSRRQDAKRAQSGYDRTNDLGWPPGEHDQCVVAKSTEDALRRDPALVEDKAVSARVRSCVPLAEIDARMTASGEEVAAELVNSLDRSADALPGDQPQVTQRSERFNGDGRSFLADRLPPEAREAALDNAREDLRVRQRDASVARGNLAKERAAESHGVSPVACSISELTAAALARNAHLRPGVEAPANTGEPLTFDGLPIMVYRSR